MKFCSGCNQDRPVEEFHSNKSKQDGKQSVCKKCRTDYSRAWYKKNKTLQKNRVAVNKKSKRQFLFDYLSEHPCVVCGEKRIPTLHFDHLEDKSFNMGHAVTLGKGLKLIQAEIEKCQILCANCHSMKTAEQFGWYNGLS
jgi:hypothetical protein